MDVYTDPPETTYRVNTLFHLPDHGQPIPAFAISSYQLPVVLALYSIIVQFAFAIAWQMIAWLLVGTLSANDRIKMAGLVAFWNSSDPWTAMITMASFVKGLFWRRREARDPAQGHQLLTPDERDQKSSTEVVVSTRDMTRPLLLLLLAAVFSGISLAVSILYQTWLVMENAAPVELQSVVVPELSSQSAVEVLKTASLYRPSIIRALGSAETVDDSSYRQQYSFTSNDHTIEYGYTVDATAFGLQSYLGLTQVVEGRCQLNDTWLRPSTMFPPRFADKYVLWGRDDLPALQVPGDEYPQLPSLMLDAFQQIAYETDPNRTSIVRESSSFQYALIIESACVGSATESTDPWYATEPVSDIKPALRWLYSSPPVPFRIKPGRLALVCDQDTTYCIDGTCYTLENLITNHKLPAGLLRLLGFHFTEPKLFHLALYSSAFALSNYIGSSHGRAIDAEQSSMAQDVERLVLAALLASKEAFRDSALMKLDPGSNNLLLDPFGNYLPGSGEFIIRTDRVVALRFSLLVVAPTLLAVFLLIKFLYKILRSDTLPHRFKSRQNALTAPQLLRMLDEQRAPGRNVWQNEFSSVPVPVTQAIPGEIGPSLEWSESLRRLRPNLYA